MYKSEVEEWLYSIGLPELYSYFIEDGFTSLDAVRRMRQSDIDAIVDRKGYMIILNEEIDKLNYPGYAAVPVPQTRFSSVARGVSEAPEYETRESLMARYDGGGVPSVGFASTHLARRAKSKSHRARGSSVLPNPRPSAERYLPGSAVQAYEDMFASRRALSAAADVARQAEHSAASAALEERQRRREAERQKRAKTGNLFLQLKKRKNLQRKYRKSLLKIK